MYRLQLPRLFKSAIFPTVFATALLLCTPPPAFAAPAFHLVDLGAQLLNRGPCISDNGRYIAGNGLIWEWNRHDSTPITSIDGRQIDTWFMGINDSGAGVAGSIWQVGGTVTPLSAPVAAYPHAISNSGVVIGIAHAPEESAFKWTSGTFLLLEGTGQYNYTRALDISDNGIVVGIVGTTVSLPGYWDATGVHELPNPPSTSAGGALGISASGEWIAGWVGVTQRAAIWHNGGPTKLPDLGGIRYFATNVNNSGQIVGRGYDASSPSKDNLSACYWEDGVIYRLTNLIDESGWIITDAGGISNDGLISATAYDPSGNSHAVLLVPVPEPATLIVLGLGSLVMLARRGRGRSFGGYHAESPPSIIRYGVPRIVWKASMTAYGWSGMSKEA